MAFKLPGANTITNKNSTFKKIIAVVSGKGGVGKSTSTAILANHLNNKGYKVGILDADITGPSQPKIFGINDKRCVATENGIEPIITKEGIKIVSLNLVIENEEDAVIWRSPIITNVIIQFYRDVHWGELDYLIIDMPPGTGDVPITVMQSITLSSIIVVSTPQDLVKLIVEKSISMAKKMNVKILGLIENMSYFLCPDNNKKYYIFGEDKFDDIKDKYNLDLLAKVPIDPELTKAVDSGTIEEFLKDKNYFSDKINI